MLKGFKTQLFFMLFLFVSAVQLDAGWIEIKILHTDKTYINNNTINLDLKTRELIAVRFIVHYTNDSVTDDYTCWIRDGYYGSEWYKYQFPEYAEKWKDKEINLSPQTETTTLENTVYIHPAYTSRDTVMIWYGEKTENKRITTRWQKLIINVSPNEIEYPDIESEPEFTAGTSNIITWFAIEGSSVQDVYYFDDANPVDLRKAAQRLYRLDSDDSPRTAVFENLQDGHKYGYFVRSEVITESDTLYMCSDFTYSIQDNTPPEKVVTIHAEKKANKIEVTWQGVDDAISTVEKYVIFRKIGTQNEISVDTVYSSAFEDDIFSWSDTSFNKENSIFYRVRAVDKVGNLGEGVRSNSIFISGEADDSEDSDDENTDDSDSEEFNNSYFKGSVDTLWIELSIEDTVQALLFESARDSIEYFDSKPPLKMRYFKSGWINPDILRKRGWVSENNPDKVFFVFDYTDTENAFVDKNEIFYDNENSEHIDPNFVNGRTYLRRIISKYAITQDTVWLDSKIPDCYPPNDIRNLTAEVNAEEHLLSNSKWAVKLQWEPAFDAVSGTRRYHLYRKIDGVDDDFIKQSVLSPPEFTDTLAVFADAAILNPLITYKVSSEDRVGNFRAIEESDWQVQERSLQGPQIIFTDTGSDMVYLMNDDTVITQKDNILININKFDISDVLKYEVDVNGSIEIIKNVDRSTDILDIPLPQYEVSIIQIRAVYLGNRFSMWSNTLTVIRNFNKKPENFKVVNDSANWEGNIKLSWTRASLDIEKYEIFRDGKKVGEKRTRDKNVIWTDHYGIDEVINKPGDTLTAYKDYIYTVRAVNIFREKSETAPEDVAYCNRAPEIIKDGKKYQDDNYIIRIGWKRTVPSQLQDGENIKYEIRIYQDSLAHLLRESAIIYAVNADTMYEDYKVPSGHNYIFRIRGVPNSYPEKPSGWSKPYTIPDFSLFTNLESLALPGKDIFISWDNAEYIKKFKIDTFTITRSANNNQEKIWFFPSNTLSFIDSSENLKHGQEYIYTIKAIDSLDQVLDEKSESVVCDRVAFIPDIDSSNTPVYFNQDSLKVCWKWIDDVINEDMVEGTEGADSLTIQLSIDENFPSISDQTVTTEYFKADTHRCRLVQIPKLTSRRNEEVFIRITAKDKWGHNDMSSGDVLWSSDFYPIRISVYDTVSSPAVNDFTVEYTGAYNLASDSIMVYCEWSGEEVEEGVIDSSRTILWNAKSYRIVRKLNDQEWIQDEIAVQKELNKYTYSGSTLNRDFQWQINVVDSAGNVTQSKSLNAENFLTTPEPPVPISYKSCTISEIDTVNSREYLVEIALNRSHFSLAYQNEDIKERLLCQIGWTHNDTCTCTSGWGSIQVDTTWFRLKVREKRGNDLLVESAWSQLAPFSSSSINDKNVTNIDDNNHIKTFKLYPNRPNPFNNTTNIKYELPELSDVTISIYNMKGSLIRQVTKNKIYPGSYSFTWDGTDMNQKYVSSGIYICFIRVNTESGNIWNNEIKMMLIK